MVWQELTMKLKISIIIAVKDEFIEKKFFFKDIDFVVKYTD